MSGKHTPDIYKMMFDAYIADGKARTAKEIAEICGVSEYVARKAMRDPKSGASRSGVDVFKETRPSYSTSYPGMEHGVTTVNVYVPSRESMRAAIAKAKGETQ